MIFSLSIFSFFSLPSETDNIQFHPTSKSFSYIAREKKIRLLSDFVIFSLVIPSNRIFSFSFLLPQSFRLFYRIVLFSIDKIEIKAYILWVFFSRFPNKKKMIILSLLLSRRSGFDDPAFFQ